MVARFQSLGVDAIFASPRMQTVVEQVRQVAGTATPVLLVGEPGSGKEILARALHHYSPRQGNSFVDLACSAFPDHLVESELFGYERGAIAGADNPKQGLLEMAHRGTLFLDEVSELEPRIQAKLARAFETGTYFRLGALKQTRVDVRIIATVGSGASSEFPTRLGALTIPVPPLRERPEDIEALASHFLAQQNPELRFASDALVALYSYHWPGNVRELRNTVLRSALHSKGPLLHADDLMFAPKPGPSRSPEAILQGLEGLEQAMIRRALEDSGGHRDRAAASLGMTRASLARKIRSYGLSAVPMRQWRSA
jgi:transcriptional regulator with PAS, ATPase and Fis domain